MRSTNIKEPEYKIAVNIENLQKMLDAGRNSAEQLATEAGAIIRIGKRKLYSVKKIEDYVNSIAGNEAQDDL